MLNFELLSELLETSATACENFLKSEIALNDGDVELCQKYSKDGQQLVKTLIKDTFKEFRDEFNCNIEDVQDYDYPNNMELVVALNKNNKNIGALLSSDDDKIKNLIIEKLCKSINTVIEIYLTLFEN